MNLQQLIKDAQEKLVSLYDKKVYQKKDVSPEVAEFVRSAGALLDTVITRTAEETMKAVRPENVVDKYDPTNSDPEIRSYNQAITDMDKRYKEHAE